MKAVPEPLPNQVLIWIGLAFGGILLAIGRFPGLGWWGRAGVVGLAVLAVLLGSAGVNYAYQEYPNARVLLAPWLQKQESFDKAAGKEEADVLTVPPGKTISDVWKPPANMPTQGTITSHQIPGTQSKFNARPTYIYLPPAYDTKPRPLLPVLVLIHGQPGAPFDWVQGGEIQANMGKFAAAHGGLAPMIVMPDATGSEMGNPMCLDSNFGNVQTYLTVDVPNW